METQKETALQLRELKNAIRSHEDILKRLQVQMEEKEAQLVTQMECDGVEKFAFVEQGGTITLSLKKDIIAKMPTTIKALSDPSLVAPLKRCERVLHEHNVQDILKTSVVVSVPAQHTENVEQVAKAVNNALKEWQLSCGIRSDAHFSTLRKTLREILSHENLNSDQRAEIIQAFEVQDKITITIKE